MTDTNFEAIVDRAAREMTDVPIPDLRAAVQARLSAEPRRAARLSMWRLAAAAATVVVAATAWFAVHEAGIDSRTPAPAVTMPAPASLSTAAPAGPAAPRHDVADVVPAPRRRAPRRPAAPAPSAAELAWVERAIPSLDAPAPLDFTAIQPAPVLVPLLDVKPIATEPVVIAPLGGLPGRGPAR